MHAYIPFALHFSWTLIPISFIIHAFYHSLLLFSSFVLVYLYLFSWVLLCFYIRVFIFVLSKKFFLYIISSEWKYWSNDYLSNYLICCMMYWLPSISPTEQCMQPPEWKCRAMYAQAYNSEMNFLWWRYDAYDKSISSLPYTHALPS
jgi:hypothetical protein